MKPVLRVLCTISYAIHMIDIVYDIYENRDIVCFGTGLCHFVLENVLVVLLYDKSKAVLGIATSTRFNSNSTSINP
jgi:hypothetical protein